jgi:hypothetical protein
MPRTKARQKWDILEREIDLNRAAIIAELNAFKFISRRFFYPELHRNYKSL